MHTDFLKYPTSIHISRPLSFLLPLCEIPVPQILHGLPYMMFWSLCVTLHKRLHKDKVVFFPHLFEWLPIFLHLLPVPTSYKVSAMMSGS